MKNQRLGFILKNLLSVMLVCVSVNIWAQRVINLNDENTDFKLRAATASAIPQEVLKEAKTARTFAINPALQNAKSVSVGDVVTLQLFDDSNYTTTVSNIVTDVNNNFTLTLKLPDYPFAYAIITTDTEGKSLVTVSIPEHGRSFGSRYDINTGVSYLIEIDKSKVELPPMENDAIPVPQETEIFELDNNGNPQKSPQLKAAQAATCGPVAKENPNADATIDLLIVYTPAAAMQANLYGGINNAIANMIATGNICFSNSQTGITLLLAHSAQVNYSEPAPSDMQTTLLRLVNPSDGYLDNVHTLRKQYNADLVQLITIENDAGGIAFLNANDKGNLASSFSVVNVGAGNSFTSAHEIGHNMGLAHCLLQTTMQYTGIFEYSYGWRWQGTSNNMLGNRYYSTVMTYPHGMYYSDGKTSERISYFSNPNLTHQGQAMGDATQADAARSLREMKHVIAHYGDRILDAPTNVVVTPTNNGATFNWDAVPNAVSYQIYASSIHSTTNTTFTVNTGTACNYYEFAIYAVNACGEKGNEYRSTYRTSCPITAPNVLTQTATNIAQTTATLNKSVTAGSQTITAQGFEYRKVEVASWITTTNSNLTGLTANTTYQFRAYATTSSGTYYGSILTFTTLHAPPTVVTQAATDITQTWAVLNMSLTSGTQIMLERGYEYRASGETIWLTSTMNVIAGLTASTTYQFRAYATTISGTTYGNTLTFTTLTPPTVVTLTATDITCNSATLNKKVTKGSESITTQQFQYRVLGAANWTESSNGKLTKLIANTTYEFRAYATTASNETYGDILTFTANASQPQTIDFPEIAEQTYGDDKITLPPTTSAGLTINYESSNTAVATVSNNVLTIKGAGEAIITATQNGNCVYMSATTVPRILTVSKIPLTITAEDKIRTQAQENPEFTLAYDGFKNDETESVLDILPTIFCEADGTSPEGFYDIILSGGSDNNYQYILVNGILEIINPVGIDKMVAKQLLIFPNPVKDELIIDNGQLTIDNIEIADLAGKIIVNCQLSIGSGRTLFVNSINVSALSQGVYLLKVYTDKGLIVRKIVKTND